MKDPENGVKVVKITDFGEKDNMTSIETIAAFAKQIDAERTVMKNGEHWFHTNEQIKFLDDWIEATIK